MTTSQREQRYNKQLKIATTHIATATKWYNTKQSKNSLNPTLNNQLLYTYWKTTHQVLKHNNTTKIKNDKWYSTSNRKPKGYPKSTTVYRKRQNGGLLVYFNNATINICQTFTNIL